MTNLKEFDSIIINEARKWRIPGLSWEDIAQEVRIHLWQKENLHDVAKSSYKTWANKVMRNCICNLLRDSDTKKARYLNWAISIEWLNENYMDIDNERNICTMGDEQNE